MRGKKKTKAFYFLSKISKIHSSNEKSIIILNDLWRKQEIEVNLESTKEKNGCEKCRVRKKVIEEKKEGNGCNLANFLILFGKWC